MLLLCNEASHRYNRRRALKRGDGVSSKPLALEYIAGPSNILKASPREAELAAVERIWHM